MRDERYDMNNKRPNVFISEERARMLNKIDPRLIQPNGRYPGYINGQPVGILKYEEIMYLRKKYNDPTIAEGYEFNGVKAFQPENLQTRKSTAPIQNPRQPRNPNEIQRREAANAQQTRQSSSRNVPNPVQRPPKKRKHKKYALQRTRRFVGYAIQAIEKDGKKILVRFGSTVLAVVVAASVWSGFKNKGTDITLGPETTITIEDSNVAGTQEEITTGVVIDEEQELMEWRQQTIAKYAYAYNLDYKTTWYFFVGITNNFQDEAYLNNYTIENISCKGSGQLYCSSEEEIISYTSRYVKQAPEKLGLTKEQLARKTNDYVRPTTVNEYKQIIFNLCKVHNADPALIYAIVRQETGFKSDYFMQYNNPGGIYFDGKIPESNCRCSGCAWHGYVHRIVLPAAHDPSGFPG